MIFLYGAYLLFQMRTHQYLFEAAEAEEEEEAEVATMNLPSAIIALAVITVLTSFCADYLVVSLLSLSHPDISAQHGLDLGLH